MPLSWHGTATDTNPRPRARTAATGTRAAPCTPLTRRRYLAKLSGPLLDRVDVKVELLPVGRAELLSDQQLAEPSDVVAARAGGQAASDAPPEGHPVAAERRDSRQRAASQLPASGWFACSAGACHGSRPDQRARRTGSSGCRGRWLTWRGRHGRAPLRLVQRSACGSAPATDRVPGSAEHQPGRGSDLGSVSESRRDTGSRAVAVAMAFELIEFAQAS
jgi:hypothetical protein